MTQERWLHRGDNALSERVEHEKSQVRLGGRWCDALRVREHPAKSQRERAEGHTASAVEVPRG